MRNYKLRFSALFLCALLLSARMSSAQSVSAPRTLSYQGVLRSTGSSGNILAGTRLLTVTLYGDANGTMKLWQSTMNVPVDSTGIFNCLLGSADNPLPPPSTMDRAIWLGVAIDDAPELRPLSEVTASVYAINVADSAITSAKIADGAITGEKLAPGSVTPDKLNMDYISSVSVNGEKITSKGANLDIVGGDGMIVTYQQDSNRLVLNTTEENSGQPAPIHNGGGTVDYWGEAGNSLTGTPPWSPNEWFGSSNDFEVRMKTNGNIALRLEPGGSTPNIAGGDATNVVNNSDLGGSATGGGIHNTIKSTYSAIGAGNSNIIDTLADESFLGSGLNNAIGTYGGGFPVGDTTVFGAEFIGAGMDDSVKSAFSAIMSGISNLVDTFAEQSFIVGGSNNKITGSGVSLIVGGDSNMVTGIGGYIVSGVGNHVDSGGSIGVGKDNHSAAQWALIGSGIDNVIPHTGGAAFIGGGSNNFASANLTFVGAGSSDSIHAFASGAVAGQNAIIDSGSFYSFIGAGYYNHIDTASPKSAILGGNKNLLWGSTSNIGGGDTNTIYADSHTAYADNIGGGFRNTIYGSDSGAIAGGAHNDILLSPNGFIGGGSGDQITTVTSAAIVGGNGNTIGILAGTFGDYSIIGGGYHNVIQSGYDVIGGGDTNTISASDYSVIVGGDTNIIASAANSIIGGGQDNGIAFGSDHAAIVGGDSNQIESNYPFSAIVAGAHNTISIAGSEPGRANFIGAGDSNLIDGNGSQMGTDPANASAIVAGIDDTVHEALSFIGSGENNRIWDDGDFIGAGTSNIDSNGSENGIVAGRGNKIDIVLADDFGPAFIGGGDSNSTFGSMSAIGGGHSNKITVNGPAADIPGGDSLTANSYAQTVIGYNNHTATSITKAQTETGVAGTTLDNPLFIIGNGKTGAGKTNAFEVSYDGHSDVFDINNSTSAAGRTPILGATYVDNIIYGWGDVLPSGLGAPNPVTIIADFGVTSVTNPHNGVFVVTLLNNGPDGAGAFTFVNGSITATLKDLNFNKDDTTTSKCGSITVSRIGNIGGTNNRFIVRTFDSSCDLADRPFYFKVCAR